jgi:alcohol dehydrogenase
MGTSYSALRKAQFSPGQTVLVDGGTGTLGLGAVILALAMGAAKVFATGRNQALLKKLHQIDPRRVVPITLGERPTAEIVMEATGGYGVDALIETLGPNAPVATVLDSFNALRRGGKAINIGGVADPIPLEPFPLMCLQKSYIGSLWFTTAEGQDMAAMAHAGTLDLGVFEHERFPLDQVNEALDAIDKRTGGFTNVVIMH